MRAVELGRTTLMNMVVYLLIFFSSLQLSSFVVLLWYSLRLISGVYVVNVSSRSSLSWCQNENQTKPKTRESRDNAEDDMQERIQSKMPINESGASNRLKQSQHRQTTKSHSFTHQKMMPKPASQQGKRSQRVQVTNG